MDYNRISPKYIGILGTDIIGQVIAEYFINPTESDYRIKCKLEDYRSLSDKSALVPIKREGNHVYVYIGYNRIRYLTWQEILVCEYELYEDD